MEHLGANDDAIKYCEKVLKIDSNDEHALKNKMFAYEKLEKKVFDVKREI